MKKYWSFVVVLVICGIFTLISKNDVMALIDSEGCYRAQYEVDVSKAKVNNGGQYDIGLKHNGTIGAKTNKICPKDYKGDGNIRLKTSKLWYAGDDISYPNFDSSADGKSVTLTFCDTGPTIGEFSKYKIEGYNGCPKKNRQTVDFSFEGKDFNTLVAEIDAFLRSAPKRKGFTLEEPEQAQSTEEITDNVQVVDKDGNPIEDKSRCKDAASSLGWIICPIIEGIAEFANAIYTDWIAPALHVEPKLFDSSGSSSGLRAGWETFRNFANIIFVILLLFVIFSQITGVGIDNYGIKKILPKLIVAAVLINLSYVLCVLAVDISNILGNSFQALFETLGQGLTDSASTSDNPTTFKEIAVTGGSLVGLGVLGVAVFNPGTLTLLPAMIIPLFISAISLIMSIMFLFILLAAREAAILVLTVLAPIAIVCYALPNTKSYFSKWLKFFGSLLMIYPIAGLLVGGGNYVSALILAAGSGDSFFMAFTAMIAGVIPIFFIPTVLKSSLNMAGNLGAKISGFGAATGARLGRAAGAGLGANRRFQSFQREVARNAGLAADHATVARIDRRRDRIAARLQKKEGLSKDEAQQQATEYLRDADIRDKAYAQQGINRAAREDQEALNIMANEMHRDSTMAQMEGLLGKAVESGNEAQIEQMIAAMTNKFGPAAAEAVAKKLESLQVKDANGNENKTAVSAIHGIQNAIQNNAAFAGAFKDKSPDAYAMATNGGRDKNGELQSLSHFSETQSIATNISDWSKASAGAIERSMTKEMAEAIIASNDPAIMSSIKSDAAKMEAVNKKAGISNERPASNATDTSSWDA